MRIDSNTFSTYMKSLELEAESKGILPEMKHAYMCGVLQTHLEWALSSTHTREIVEKTIARNVSDFINKTSED